jgi:hypothetical protein
MQTIYRNPTRETLQLLPRVPFFYVIQNRVSSKYYAGIKYADPNPSTFMTMKGYRTSSDEIMQDDPNNYIIRRIVFIENKSSLYLKECLFLQRVDAINNPKMINKTNGTYTPGVTQHSEKTKEKIRLGNLGKKRTHTTLKNIGISSKRNWEREEYRQRMIEQRNSPEENARRVAGAKEMWKDPERRKKASMALTGKKRTPEQKQRMREARLRYFERIKAIKNPASEDAGS